MLITVVAAGAISALTAGQAQAVGPNDEADRIAGVIESVAPNDVLTPTMRADGGFDAPGSIDATLPETSDGAVAIGDLTISLPGSASTGRVATDGTVVYAESGGSPASAIQVESGALRIQTVTGVDDSTEFHYEVTGASAVLRADGGIDLLREVPGTQGQLHEILGVIDAPWAVDADGRSVSTRFDVEGNEVVQRIEPDAKATYPVVADPRISVGAGVYASLNNTEMKALATIANTAASVGVAAGCVAIGEKIKAAKIAPFIKYICGLTGATTLLETLKAIPSKVASTYTASCYQLRFPAQTPVVKVVAASQCLPLSQSYAISG